jgi:hypothetical protein
VPTLAVLAFGPWHDPLLQSSRSRKFSNAATARTRLPPTTECGTRIYKRVTGVDDGAPAIGEGTWQALAISQGRGAMFTHNRTHHSSDTTVEKLRVGTNLGTPTKRDREPKWNQPPEFDAGERNIWSGREDSNLRPPGPEPGALARLSHAPTGNFTILTGNALWTLRRVIGQTYRLTQNAGSRYSSPRRVKNCGPLKQLPHGPALATCRSDRHMQRRQSTHR